MWKGGPSTWKAISGRIPVAEAAVVVFGTHGKTVAEGKTDNQGLFQFDAPGTACDLTIEVNASMGHKATYTLKKEDWSK